MTPLELYIVLAVAGIVLIALEIFIVGGVLGMLGGCCIMGAAYIGFQAFGPSGGAVSLLALLLGTCVFFIIWIRLFPHTPIGRKIALHQRMDQEKANPLFDEMLNKTGETTTDLRPSGKARIDDRRIDVVAQSGYIESGCPVEVVQVEGPKIIVRKVG